MSQTFRHPEILETARRQGKVTVEGLAEQFGVTLQTIRRDLTDLAEAGRLERVHGGAILPSGTTNILYEERRILNQAAKTDIARACAAEIPEGSSVFLNIGTSTEAVAHELLHHRDLMVVTNNMNVANILAANRDCEIILTGGTLRRLDGGLIGTLTVATIRQFKFDRPARFRHTGGRRQPDHHRAGPQDFPGRRSLQVQTQRPGTNLLARRN